jgi:hypothetical protein
MESIYEIDLEGNKRWILNGQLHREDGPAIEFVDGTRYWFFKDNLHREKGPAQEYIDGTKAWYIHGKLHRLDGPAVEYISVYNGKKNSWYLNDKCIGSEEEFNRLVKLKAFW